MSVIRRMIVDGVNAREASREAPTKNGRWRASDTGKCEIQQILKAFDVEESDPPDYELTLKFQVCSHLEHFVTDTIVRALEGRDDVLVLGSDDNALADNELNVSGHADIVIYDKKSAKPLELIEVKALSYFFWRKFEKEPIENAYFYGQMQMYMHMLGMNTSTLVVVERNTPLIHSIEVPFDDIHWWHIENMYKNLNRYYEAVELPLVGEVEGEMACQFCAYRTLCGEGENDLAPVLDAQARREGTTGLSEEGVGAGERGLQE